MIIVLFRLLILLAIVFLSYTFYLYLTDPKRKLDKAKQKKVFYMLDDKENDKKNLYFTYKGILFEGEKYIGANEEAFDVVTISVHVLNPEEMAGFDRNDLYFLEEELLIHYPFAEIDWKPPVNQLVFSKK